MLGEPTILRTKFAAEISVRGLAVNVGEPQSMPWLS